MEATLRGAHPVLARVVRVLLDPEAEAEIAWDSALQRELLALLAIIEELASDLTPGRRNWSTPSSPAH